VVVEHHRLGVGVVLEVLLFQLQPLKIQMEERGVVEELLELLLLLVVMVVVLLVAQETILLVTHLFRGLSLALGKAGLLKERYEYIKNENSWVRRRITFFDCEFCIR
jgi:hypothetical protein